MNNPRYDDQNYIKHLAKGIDSNDFHELDIDILSSTLIIKWHTLGDFKSANNSNLIGTVRVLKKTPLGEERPRDYQFNVDILKTNQRPYINFLELNGSAADCTYRLYVKNPAGVPKSKIEIWEYQPPQNYLNSSANLMSTYGNDQITIDNSAVVAAINSNNANTVAAINALPNNIADSIANNAMNTTVSNPITVNNVLTVLKASDPNCQGLEISNRGNTKMRIAVTNTAPPANSTYANIPFTVELIAAIGSVGSPGYKVGGTWVADKEQAKSAIYIISDAPNGTVVTTTTVTAP